MNLRLAALALMPLALAACDQAAMSDLQGALGMKPAAAEAAAEPAAPPAPPQPPAVSPLDAPIEIAGAEQVAAPTADAETLATDAFVARGNEPFFRVEVAGGTALYKTTGNQAGRRVKVDRLAFAKGVEYVGKLDDAAFALTIRGADCTDSMSGAAFPMTATLRVGSRTLTGCAAPAGAEPAAPAAAAATDSAAAAAPKA